PRACRRASAVAGAGGGRKIRNRDQFGTAHLAAARVPGAPGRSQAGLVDRQRGGETSWVWRSLRVQFGGGGVSRTCRTVGVREQRRSRFRYRRAEIAVGRGVRYDVAGIVAAPAWRYRAAAAVLCRRSFLFK